MPDRKPADPADGRIGVRKTYKLFIGGAFPRSESGRSYPVRTPQEAVEKANNTPYGLSAGVWTDKGSRILWMADKLRAGVVWANTFNRFDPTSPFGGYQESGYGREGGRHGLAPYLRFDE